MKTTQLSPLTKIKWLPSDSPTSKETGKPYRKAILTVPGEIAHFVIANAYGRTREETEQRARLIAAAPEMLELLEKFEQAVFPNAFNEMEALMSLFKKLAGEVIKKVT